MFFRIVHSRSHNSEDINSFECTVLLGQQLHDSNNAQLLQAHPGHINYQPQLNWRHRQYAGHYQCHTQEGDQEAWQHQKPAREEPGCAETTDRRDEGRETCAPSSLPSQRLPAITHVFVYTGLPSSWLTICSAEDSILPRCCQNNRGSAFQSHG